MSESILGAGCLNGILEGAESFNYKYMLVDLSANLSFMLQGNIIKDLTLQFHSVSAGVHPDVT